MTASGAFAAEESGAATIDEIVVTGQKREENLQQVAAAATVIGGSSLQERGITRLDGLQTAVPSLSITDAGLTQSVNIRGVGLASGSPNAANGVATYFDGVFQPPIVSTNSFYDIGAVEVFRGPQGTFVGSNSTGGAIFINSRNPEMGATTGYLEGELGRYSRAGADGAVNLPLGDTLAVRLAGIYRTRDSFYNRLDGAKPPGSLDEKGARLSIKWEPTDNFSALLKGEIARKSTDGYAYRPTPGAAFAAARTNDPYTLNYNTPTRNDEKGDQLSGRLEYVTNGGLTLRSISGYQNKRISNLYDSDGTSVARNTQDQFVRERVWTEELNLLSPTTGPVSYIAGGYFQRNRIDVDIVNNSAAPVHTHVVIGNKKTTTGVFGQVTWEVTPQLSLDVGGRYSWYKVDGDGGVYLVTPTPTPTYLANPGGHEKDDQFTGKIALNWTPRDGHLVYGFVAKGYKSGGLQSPTSNFAPEKVIDYEIGWKGTFLGGALTSQLGAFYYDYKNFQLDALNPTTGQNAVINLTNAKVKGLEGQVQAHLGEFRLNAGVGYTDSSLAGTTFVDIRGVALAFPGVNNAPQCPAGQPSRPPACLDYGPFLRSTAGGPNLFSPKWTWNLDASYRFETAAVAITPRASLSHVGGRWAYIGYNPQRDYLPGFTLLNANLEFEVGRYTVDLFATNLTKERYVTGQTGGGANEFYGAPREYGVRARVEF
jgi:iron complex outermembrane receptor protein